MPALTWIEDKQSRAATIVRAGTRGTASYTKSFKIFGSDDDQVVHADVSATVMQSLYFWQYPFSNVQCTVESYTLAYLGDKCWQLTINYEKKGADDDNEPEPLKRARSFDTGGGTQHITQALSETAFGTNAPNQQKAIAVDDERVSGVDIVVPALQWSETYDVPATYVTAAWIKTVAELTGTTNSAAFRTFSPGEVLFVGCSGQQEWDEKKGDGPWSLAFKFVASPNAGSGMTLPALTVGSISGIEKRGHEYMWVRYEADVSQDTVIKKPRHVYVNRVYREGDFSKLGIGVN
jgi:hypothetical protein